MGDTEPKKELTADQKAAIVGEGLRRMNIPADTWLVIPENAYGSYKNEQRIIRAGQLGDFCVEMFSPGVPQDVTKEIITGWKFSNLGKE